MIDRREIPARAGRSFAARQCPLDQMRDLVGALVPRVDVDHTHYGSLGENWLSVPHC
jgi:hypothetical protein